MSESETFRLLKQDGEVYGPFTREELLELGNTARVSPADKVSTNEGDWKVPSEVAFLKMHWVIISEGGDEYGPTNASTIREFLEAGEVTETTQAKNISNGSKKTVKEVLKSDRAKRTKNLSQSTTSLKPDKLGGNGDHELEDTLNMARDLRIRQLETDLNQLNEKYEDLLHKYRRTSEELLRVKSGS